MTLMLKLKYEFVIMFQLLYFNFVSLRCTAVIFLLISVNLEPMAYRKQVGSLVQ